MKTIITGACIAFILLGIPLRSHGHAMFATPIDGGVGVQAVYDNGRPAAFSEVAVFGPNDTPFVSGHTDPNGRFLFRPDRDGTWRVTVDDGMGHIASLSYEIGADMLPADTEYAIRMPRRYGVIAGLGVIFGLSGWSAYIRSRKRVGS